MFSNLPALLVFGFASSGTPGPNNLMLMTSGLNHGWRRTLPHFWGVNVGYGLLILTLGLGLAAVLGHVPHLLLVLKCVGAAYLIYLAARIALSAAPRDGVANATPMTFLQAVAFQWVNPKAWLQSLTALATFTIPTAYEASVALVALILAVTNLPGATLWTLFGTSLKTWLGQSSRLAIFNYTMAFLLIASAYPILRS